MNNLHEWALEDRLLTHLCQEMRFQQPEKYTLLRHGGIISIVIVLYVFRRKKS